MGQPLRVEEKDPFDEINIKARQIKREEYESATKQLSDRFGICGECEYFQYAETEFKVVRCFCSEFHKNRAEYNKIIKCTGFYPKKQLSLHEMYQIAEIIDIQKDKVGFLK